MARKIVKVIIDADGRDFGKVFVLREMSASDAEEWGLRALSALLASGVEIPDDIAKAGLMGVARMGIAAFGGMPWALLKPLLAEMFTCVRFQPVAGVDAVTRELVEDDIEEVSTRIKLRAELFKLHMGFLLAAIQSTPDPIAATQTPA